MMFLAGNISAPPTIMPAKADEAPIVSARAIRDDLNMGNSCLNFVECPTLTGTGRFS
jgi:hypothetical protein